MRPITREIMEDRRQPGLRWSAVFAGTVISVAVWVVLQMFGMGVGLAAIDLTNTGSLRSVGIGTTVWSIIAPLIALFIGGFAATKFAHTYDQRSGAGHGVVTWAIASILGILALGSMASMLARGVAGLSMALPSDVTIDPSLRARELQQATDQIGKILLGVAVSMLLGLGAAVIGGLAAARHSMQPRRRTAETPVVPPPEEPPHDAPKAAS